METKDFFALFKVNILRNSKITLALILWLILFLYLPHLISLLPRQAVEQAQRFIPPKDSWLISFSLLAPLIWILTFLVGKETLKRIKNYTKKGVSYKLSRKNWYTDWIYNGKTKPLLSPLRLRINSSRAGCLLDKYLWKNFYMRFEFRLLKANELKSYFPIFGIVFRAKDLENYFMLEINREGTEIWIKPHVRYEGMWETMSEDRLGQIDVNQEWLSIALEVKGGIVHLNIEGLDSYTWHLPTHVDINHIEDGVKTNSGSSFEEGDFGSKIPSLPKIEFREADGMIGFRAHIYQGAEIRNLKIRAIV